MDVNEQLKQVQEEIEVLERLLYRLKEKESELKLSLSNRDFSNHPYLPKY
jgi:SMC interacting uncharacterized protein involved in chromosome segregation